MKVDSAMSTSDLVRTWAASGRIFAVTAGSLVALVSLMANTPIHVASIRGGIAFMVVRALTSLGGWLLPRVTELEEPQQADEPLAPGLEAGE